MKLPNVAYFYWGNETMSFLRYMSLYSFRKFNPSWRVVLIKRRIPTSHKDYGWVEKPDFIQFSGKDCSDMISDLDIEIQYLEDEYPDIANMDMTELHVGDVLQWRILAERGGVFSDMDILYYKPIDYEHIKRVDVGLISFDGSPKPEYTTTSFMLGMSNEFFMDMYEYALDNVNPAVWESAGSHVVMSRFKGIEDIGMKYPNLKVVRLPSHMVFPLSETEHPFVEYSKMMFFDTVKIPNDSIGIHWYGSSPISQEFNNKITRYNYGEFDNTICKIIGDVYEEDKAKDSG